MTPPPRRPRAGARGGRDAAPSGSARRANPERRAGGHVRTQRESRPGVRGIGGEQVEGRHAVRELLSAGRRAVREVWIGDDLDPSPLIDDIERLASARRIRVVAVSRARLARAAHTDAPQGVLARAAPLPEVELDQLCRSPPAPFLLVLDGVTDPHNVGSLLRSAECAGVTGIVLPRHRAAHVTATVAKVAAGAVEHLDLALVSGVPNALRRLGDAGVMTIGLDAVAPTSLFELGPEATGPVALVLGAEGRGLAPLSRRRCEVLASIPQFGALAALNVAAAGAVACFELARRRAGAPAVPVATHHGVRHRR